MSRWDHLNELRRESMAKRAANRERSEALLKEWGVSFETKNGGAHLIVSHGGKVADFWPGTGKYRVRRGGYKRGVFNLLDDLGSA